MLLCPFIESFYKQFIVSNNDFFSSIQWNLILRQHVQLSVVILPKVGQVPHSVRGEHHYAISLTPDINVHLC